MDGELQDWRRWRTHSPAFKAHVLQACSQPGLSIAAVAIPMIQCAGQGNCRQPMCDGSSMLLVSEAERISSVAEQRAKTRPIQAEPGHKQS